MSLNQNLQDELAATLDKLGPSDARRVVVITALAALLQADQIERIACTLEALAMSQSTGGAGQDKP